jgi:hypothetical protein
MHRLYQLTKSNKIKFKKNLELFNCAETKKDRNWATDLLSIKHAT